MYIHINNEKVEVSGQEPLIEELRRHGCDIPSMCYAKNARHEASCMVCVVKETETGRMIPSCSTMPTEGMRIDTESDEVVELRRMSMHLLLSDHRADCEAPCTLVCPHGLDPAKILLCVDRGKREEAYRLTASSCDVNNLPCNDCKAPCEKACRRGTVDKCVGIKDIISSLCSEKSTKLNSETQKQDSKLKSQKAKSFTSKLGRYTDAEKEYLKEVYNQPSRCLHCACEGNEKCVLREIATKLNIKSPKYGVSSSQPVKTVVEVVGNLRYEPAKCIRCGLCVYNSEDGFTFVNRGFEMQVMIPEESKANVSERLAELCPTGALYIAR